MEATPLTPHDPSQGLPQPRPRILSSDVSEDGGSRRSSISEATPFREGAFNRASESKSNVFDSAFRQELRKAELSESSKVEFPLVDKAKKRNMKRLSLNVDNVLLSPHHASPLLSKIEPKIGPIYAPPKSPSPQPKITRPVKELHISADDVAIDELHSSMSVSNKSTPSPDTVDHTPLDELLPESPEKELEIPKIVNQEMEVLEEADSSNRSKEHVVGLEEVLSKLSESEGSEFEAVVKKETEEQALEMRYSSTPSPSTPSQPHTPTPPAAHLHTLTVPPTHSHTPSPASSLPHTPSPPTSLPHTPPPPTSQPHTPPPQASRPRTPPTQASRPHTPSPQASQPHTPSLASHEQSYPPPHDELSDDDLSISDEGSTKSDLEDTKLFSEQSNSSNIELRSVHSSTIESLTREERTTSHDDGAGAATVKAEPVDVAGFELSEEIVIKQFVFYEYTPLNLVYNTTLR